MDSVIAPKGQPEAQPEAQGDHLSKKAALDVRAEGRPRTPPNSRPGPKSPRLLLEEHRFVLALWRGDKLRCPRSQQPIAVDYVVGVQQEDRPPSRTAPGMAVG